MGSGRRFIGLGRGSLGHGLGTRDHGGGAGAQSVLATNAANSATPPADWTYNVSASSSSYLILGYATNYVVSEAFSTEGFTNLTVDCYARSYGTVSGTQRTNLTVSISSDNGANWTVVGAVAPANNVMNAMPTLTTSANLGNAQTRIRWQAPNATANSGVGIQSLVVKGWSAGGGPAYVAGYSNRTVSGTSQAVTGLTTGVTYYFRARAVNAAGTGANSSVASVVPASGGGGDPVVEVTTLPTNAAQHLSMELSTSQVGSQYVLEYTTNLLADPIVFIQAAPGVDGTGNAITLQDPTNAPVGDGRFYRILKY